MHSELHNTVTRTLDVSKDLMLCLDRENACLIARKYEQLMEVAQYKQQLVEQLDSLDKQRRELTAIDDFESYMRNSADSQLQQIWSAIRSNIQECARKNEVNGRLLHRQGRLTREAMEILTGRSPSSENTYNANGTTSGQGSLLPNIEA